MKNWEDSLRLEMFELRRFNLTISKIKSELNAPKTSLAWVAARISSLEGFSLKTSRSLSPLKEKIRIPAIYIDHFSEYILAWKVFPVFYYMKETTRTLLLNTKTIFEFHCPWKMLIQPEFPLFFMYLVWSNLYSCVLKWCLRADVLLMFILQLSYLFWPCCRKSR